MAPNAPRNAPSDALGTWQMSFRRRGRKTAPPDESRAAQTVRMVPLNHCTGDAAAIDHPASEPSTESGGS